MAIPQARSHSDHVTVTATRPSKARAKATAEEAVTAQVPPPAKKNGAATTRRTSSEDHEHGAKPSPNGGSDHAAATSAAASSAALGGHDATAGAAAELHASLKAVFAQVVHTLPATATLGEIVDAATGSAQMLPLLNRLTVRELIDIVTSRPRDDRRHGEHRADAEISYDEDGNPMLALDAGPQIVRRRADVPDGDLLVLRALQSQGPLGEAQLARATRLSSEQVRLIVRSLKTRALVHLEGSGAKCRIKITRSGASMVRR